MNVRDKKNKNAAPPQDNLDFLGSLKTKSWEEASSHNNLINKSNLGYDGLGDQREVPIPLLKKKLNEKDCRKYIKHIAETLDAATVEVEALRLKDDYPEVFAGFQSPPLSQEKAFDVPLWAERKTGREVSPVDFIKTHYGRIDSDGSWDSQGLTRADIRQTDKKLYQAYAAWISPKRHPEDDLDLPTEERSKDVDPEEFLIRQRATNLRSYHKRKFTM